MPPKLYICGQAPSRQGDGRPFTGPSGDRLVKLFGLRDYEHLASQFTLINLLDQPASNVCAKPSGKKHAGDAFDRDEAVIKAFGLMLEWWDRGSQVVVLACGSSVTEALLGVKVKRFKGRRVRNVEIWHFPHPSGASHFWNSPDNVERSREFLKRLLDRYEIAITE